MSRQSLEIAHVLFMDIVGYSALPMDQQTMCIEQLNRIVRDTEEFKLAQANDHLLKLATGDGMALVFFIDPIAPIRCACAISAVLRESPDIKLRMGIHTGPVYRVSDINAERNVAGGGINIAQRVMDCGDEGHILVSNTVAEVLGQLSDWADKLHDLGQVQVKHGLVLHLHNLLQGEIGNPLVPTKIASSQKRIDDAAAESPKGPIRYLVRKVRKSRTTAILASVAGVLLLAAVVAGAVITYRALRSTPPAQKLLSRMTFDSGLQTEPVWSPDGRFIAYTSDKRGNFDIYVQQIGSDRSVLVTENSSANDWQPDWSPDESEIVYRSERDAGGLYVTPAFGGRERKISSFGYKPRWSPDGGKILFVSSSLRITELPKIYVVALDGSPPQQILADSLKGFRAIWSATWHPDGKRISFLGRMGESGWDFWTVPASGGDPVKSNIPVQDKQTITTVAAFRWSPQGNAVYFEGTSSGGLTNLWKVELDPNTLQWKGVPELLTSGLQDTDLALSQDGKKLAFTMRVEKYRIWQMPFDSAARNVKGEGKPITSPEIDALFPDMTLDEASLVFIGFRAGIKRQELIKVSLNDLTQTSLEYDDFRRIAPRWSRDGKFLAYRRSRYNSDHSKFEHSIVVLPANGGDEQVITTASQVAFDLAYDWANDDTWILGGSNRNTKRVAIYKFPVSAAPHAEAQMQLVTANEGYDLWQARLSPNGRWICFNAVKAGESGDSVIYVVPQTGGDWARITDGSFWSDKPRWSPDGKVIYFISNRGTSFFNVWGINFDETQGTTNGVPFEVTNFNSPRHMLSPLIASVDIGVTKSSLVLPIQETSGNIWILETITGIN